MLNLKQFSREKLQILLMMDLKDEVENWKSLSNIEVSTNGRM